MAYYHRNVPLSRFERFELSGDVKKSTTKSAQKKPDDFGSGIAAQFGLVKKKSTTTIIDKGRRKTKGNVHIPVKKRKGIDFEEEDKDDMCKSTDKCIPVKRIEKKQQSHHVDMKDHSQRSPKPLPREINFLTHHGCSDLEESQNHKCKVHKRNKKNKKNISGKHSDGDRSISKRRNSYSNNERSDSSDGTGNNDCSSTAKARCNQVSYGSGLKAKSRKYNEDTSHEKKKKKRKKCDYNDIDDHYGNNVNEDHGSNEDLYNKQKKSIIASGSKRVAKSELVKKQKTFTIPKVNKMTSNSAQVFVTNVNCLKSSDKSKEMEKKVNRKPKYEASDVGQTDKYTNKELITQRSNCKLTVKSRQVDIKIESNDDDYVDYDVDAAAAADVDNNDDVRAAAAEIITSLYDKLSTLLSGNEIRPMVNADDKSNMSKQRTLMNNNCVESLKNIDTINIKSEPIDHNDASSSNSKKRDYASHSNGNKSYDLWNKCGNSLFELSTVKEDRKAQARIINLGNDLCYIGKTKEVCNSKGLDLSYWFHLVDKMLEEKSTKTDDTVVTYFITLHSRFKVMQTMEINDLEVLPEEEPNTDTVSKPIRIFTNLSRDHYRQYLGKDCLNSIPELIITRLYRMPS